MRWEVGMCWPIRLAVWPSGAALCGILQKDVLFLVIVTPKHKPATSASVQPLVNKGDFDKCNVCFTADYRTSLSHEMPLHYFL